MLQRATLLTSIAYPLVIHLAVISNGLVVALFALLVLSALHSINQIQRSGIALEALMPVTVFGLTLACLVTDSHFAIFLPPVLISLGLFTLFASSLRPGREALITRFARTVMGESDAEVLVYTRHVTQVWSGFFLVMATESVLLALFAPLATWSLFTNALNYLFVALMFGAEFLYRCIRFRHKHSPTSFLRQLRSANWREFFTPQVP